MTSHALRFLVVVVKIALSVARSPKSVKKINRSAMSVKASSQLLYKFKEIQRGVFKFFFFDERGIAKSVVTNISMENFFAKLRIPI